MPRTIISEGKTSTEAIEKGLKELRLTRNQVEIKILEEKKKSFFNILDPHIVKVEITEKEGVKESQERRPRKEEKRPINKQKAKKAEEIIGNFLKEFLSKVSENIEYKIEENYQLIRKYLKENGLSKTTDIAQAIGLSPARTRAILKEMSGLEYEGTTNNRRYRLADDN